MQDSSEIRDLLHFAMEKGREAYSSLGMYGFGFAHLLDGDGKTKQLVPFWNLITDYGDEYYARRGGTGLSGGAAITAPTLVNGMKLGTSSTAPVKATASTHYIGTGSYISGSNNLWSTETSFPTVAAVGTNQGWNLNYKCSWAAGDATNGTIQEAEICNDAATDAGHSAVGASISRATFTSINKTASDTLAITWTHKFLGA